LFDSETQFELHLSCVCWLWDSIWLIVTLSLTHCFSSLFFSLYVYTYAYTYFIIYFLVLTKPVLAWFPVQASFSTSDTIVTLYTYRCTNRFVSLLLILTRSAGLELAETGSRQIIHISIRFLGWVWRWPCLSRHGSVDKIRRTKKNKHILI